MTEQITFASIHWDMILGGFALFLFGIKFMGDGLKSVAGDHLRDYIDKYTSKPIMGILIGAIVTILIQSSSASTAITIGLVRAGLMKLEQAAGIVMGANIGTTITSFLIGLKVEQYALYFVFIGGLVISFANRKKLRYIGNIIMGFGLLFYGLMLMGDALAMLKDIPEFIHFAEMMGQQPFLALVAGTIITALIQGSAASIGVIQKIYESGAITMAAVLPFLFGSNIGTTITGVIASIGGSLAAKRTACLHTLFNVLGTIIGMILLQPYVAFILKLAELYGIPPMMQIAVAHIIFNVITTIVFYPLLKQMCQLTRKIIPGTEPERIDVKVDELDTSIIHTLPASALEVAQQSILKMKQVVEQAVKDTEKFALHNGTEEDKELLVQSETLINSLDHKITDYLMLITKEDLSEHDGAELNLHLEVVKNLERIGDLSMNVTEFFEMVFEDRTDFSKEAKEDCQQMFELLDHMLNKAMHIYRTRDYADYVSLQEDENYMDLLEYKARQRHFKRMSDQTCTSNIAGSVYCDILGNLERMGDHCCNIAKSSVEHYRADVTLEN